LTISILNTGFTSSTIDPTALQPQSIQLIPNLLIDFSLILKNQFSRNNTKGTLQLVFMQVNSLQQSEKMDNQPDLLFLHAMLHLA